MPTPASTSPGASVASAGQTPEPPVQFSATSHGPAAGRHVVLDGRNPSAQAPAPSHESVPSQAPPLETPAQEVPATAKFGWQTPEAPQVSGASQVDDDELPQPPPAGVTVAAVVAPIDVQPLTVTVTVYVPEAAGVAPGIEGLCEEELNPFGPVQA